MFGWYKMMIGKIDLIFEINCKFEVFVKEKKIFFIYFFLLFMEKNSNVMWKELIMDGLYLIEEGYRIWSKVLKWYL